MTHYLIIYPWQKSESGTYARPYGRGERTIVWSILGVSVLLFVGNTLLTVKTYGDMSATLTDLSVRTAALEHVQSETVSREKREIDGTHAEGYYGCPYQCPAGQYLSVLVCR